MVNGDELLSACKEVLEIMTHNAHNTSMTEEEIMKLPIYIKIEKAIKNYESTNKIS